MPGEAQIAAQATGSLIGIGQTIGGFIQTSRANKNLNKLFKRRRAYQTPDEIFDILNMATSNASAGYSPETLDYLTSGANTALSASLGTASRLGADPNALGGLLDQYSRDIFKIGGENELVKMRKFDGVMNAMQLVAQNKEAEQISRDNLIKDQMQAEAQKLAAGNQNIQSGLNLITNSASSAATSGLYGNNTSFGSNTVTPPISSTLSGNSGVSGLQGLSPSQQIRLKQIIDSGLLD